MLHHKPTRLAGHTGFLVLFALALVACQRPAHEDEKDGIPLQAEQAQPLKTGQHVPELVLRDIDGQPLTLQSLYADHSLVLIVYRGGWCPYCTVHLGEVAQSEAELIALGYRVAVVSPDRPEKLRESLDKGGQFVSLVVSGSIIRGCLCGIVRYGTTVVVAPPIL